jgi:imidazole glycerol-phosphate synthase subunit HisH
MIAVIDYGMGNIRSVVQALKKVGLSPVVTSDVQEIQRSQAIVLPGVGAFPRAMQHLQEKRLDICLKEEINKGKAILGICLGMQLLFSESEEGQWASGLSLIPGKVRRLPNTNKVPHIGWNELHQEKESCLLEHIPKDSYVYYVHSYYVDCEEKYIDGWSDYGVRVPGVISYNNIYGTQFHPEKSGEIGLRIIQNFKQVVETCLSSRRLI